MNSLSLYIHWPYCPSRCHYCDFNAYAVGRGSTPLFEDYITALKAELKGRLKEILPRPGRQALTVESIFFGGGTPSLAPPEFIAESIALARSYLPVGEAAEITLEANPGTVSAASLRAFREAGVNRLSLAVQSLRDAELRFLGRLHDSHTAGRAAECVREAGFENFSIDLIYGLPDQTLQEWEETLEGALEIFPPHLSAYELTLEPGTPLAKRLAFTLGEEQLTEMHLRTEQGLEAAGYEHYEISNYAQPGFRCRHNTTYWTGGQYLGLGAGAHSYLGGVRSKNLRLPEEYRSSVLQRGHATEEVERLPPVRAAGEALMMGLRLKEGVDLAEVGERTGCRPLEAFGETLRELVNSGHLFRRGSRIRLTDAGKLLADAVALKFL
ncbi:MAG: radical SAM family heme chaperone HemW [Nitrospinota bacterium]